MNEFSDLGIIIEIIGFGLFLFSAKKLPERGSVAYNTGTDEEKKDERTHKRYKWFYLEIPGVLGQIARIISIGFIIGGVALQHSYFNF